MRALFSLGICAVLFVVLAASACKSLPNEFACTSDGQCAGAGDTPKCQSGYCTFADANCAPDGLSVGGGRRFHDSAGPHAGECVGAQSNRVDILAGLNGGAGFHDDLGDRSRFSSPVGAVMDDTGALLVADTRNFVIRRIDLATGQISLLAGSKKTAGAIDDTFEKSTFFNPTQMVRVGTKVYLTDSMNHCIRRLDLAAKMVSTFAGSCGSKGTAGGNLAAARFENPYGLAYDGSNAFYVSEWGSDTIRKIDVAGDKVDVIAGVPHKTGDDDGGITVSTFNQPSGLVVVGTLLYVADQQNNQLRTIDLVGATHTVTTVAGHRPVTAGGPGVAGAENKTGILSGLNTPTGITLDSNGTHILIADIYNRVIRSYELATTAMTTLAGDSSFGPVDGDLTHAGFRTPTNIVPISATQYAVLDEGAAQVRLLDLGTGRLSTLGGHPGRVGGTDGHPDIATFSAPNGVAIGPAGDIYVSDTLNNAVRVVQGAPDATTVSTLVNLKHTPGNTDADGDNGTLLGPTGIALAGDKLYIADTGNCMIRVYDTIQHTLGTLSANSTRNCGTGRKFTTLSGLVYDSTRNQLLASDGAAGQIFAVSVTDGSVTVLAGLNAAGNNDVDGALNMAELGGPSGMAIDGDTLYVADVLGHTVRAINLTGTLFVTTYSGKYSGGSDSVEGAAMQARFGAPTGLALDGQGSLFVTDATAHMIRRIALSAIATDRLASNWVGSPYDAIVRPTDPAQPMLAPLLNTPTGIAIHPKLGIITVSPTENVVLRVY